MGLDAHDSSVLLALVSELVEMNKHLGDIAGSLDEGLSITSNIPFDASHQEHLDAAKEYDSYLKKKEASNAPTQTQT